MAQSKNNKHQLTTKKQRERQTKVKLKTAESLTSPSSGWHFVDKLQSSQSIRVCERIVPFALRIVMFRKVVEHIDSLRLYEIRCNGGKREEERGEEGEREEGREGEREREVER